LSEKQKSEQYGTKETHDTKVGKNSFTQMQSILALSNHGNYLPAVGDSLVVVPTNKNNCAIAAIAFYLKIHSLKCEAF